MHWISVIERDQVGPVKTRSSWCAWFGCHETLEPHPHKHAVRLPARTWTHTVLEAILHLTFHCSLKRPQTQKKTLEIPSLNLLVNPGNAISLRMNLCWREAAATMGPPRTMGQRTLKFSRTRENSSSSDFRSPVRLATRS